MSNKNVKKNEELLENKCNCNNESCDCLNDEFEDDSFDELLNEDFSGTYTVNFDCGYDDLDEFDYDCCIIDTKKLALVGLGALLAGGALCYAVKKKKKKKK